MLFHDENLGRLPLLKAVRESVLRFQELIGRRLSSNIRFSSFGFDAEDARPQFGGPGMESDRALNTLMPNGMFNNALRFFVRQALLFDFIKEDHVPSETNPKL